MTYFENNKFIMMYNLVNFTRHLNVFSEHNDDKIVTTNGLSLSLVDKVHTQYLYIEDIVTGNKQSIIINIMEMSNIMRPMSQFPIYEAYTNAVDMLISLRYRKFDIAIEGIIERYNLMEDNVAEDSDQRYIDSTSRLSIVIQDRKTKPTLIIVTKANDSVLTVVMNSLGKYSTEDLFTKIDTIIELSENF